jgi:lysozyme family protein
MISLGNVGSPWGASLSGTTHFLADCAQPIPEPSTYAMAALGLVGLGVWSRRKKA